MAFKGSLGTLLALAALPLCIVSASAQTTRILAPGGAEPNGFSGRPAISADGRYVAFESIATNLVPNDTNSCSDIFRYDTTTGAIQRVSVDSSGGQAGNYSFAPSISGDGRLVAFQSWANNLVPGDTNGTWDVFVHDMQTGETRLVSADSSGHPGNAASVQVALSADGQYAVFQSDASNLVPNDISGVTDVFLRNLVTGATTRVSVSSEGVEGNRISGYLPTVSGDGHYVVFWSAASSLVPGDTAADDVFVRDTVAGTTTRVSVATSGQPDGDSASGAVSADGNFIAFYSKASNLVPNDTDGTGDVFLADRQTGAITRVGAAGDTFDWLFGTLAPSISGDGAKIAFSSAEPDVVPGKSNGFLQCYVYSRQSGAIVEVSDTPGGAPGNGHSYPAVLSQDGQWVAYASEATDLLPGDTNGKGDIFIRHIAAPAGFTLADVGDALRIAGGISAAGSAEATRFGAPVTVQTAVHIARKVAGLEPNP